MSDGIKLGQLLCDADIITKRQLSKALAEQVKGRKGTIGEILVEMGFLSNRDDEKNLRNSGYLRKLNSRLTKAIINYLNAYGPKL